MRARMLNIHHKTIKKLERLKKESEKKGDYRMATRIHAILLNAEGYKSGKIAKILKKSLGQVSRWIKSYEKYDLKKLIEKKRPGRPSLLSKRQSNRLSKIIAKGPNAYGYNTGVWTSILITEVIKKEFKIDYNPRHTRRLLKKMGFSFKRPKKVLSK